MSRCNLGSALCRLVGVEIFLFQDFPEVIRATLILSIVVQTLKAIEHVVLPVTVLSELRSVLQEEIRRVVSLNLTLEEVVILDGRPRGRSLHLSLPQLVLPQEDPQISVMRLLVLIGGGDDG